MDVERTIEFILEQQSQMATHMLQADARLGKIDARLAEIAEYQAKTDKQILAIAVLVKAGMKRLLRQDKKIEALIESQQRTDRKFDRLIEILSRQYTNGKRR